MKNKLSIKRTVVLLLILAITVGLAVFSFKEPSEGRVPLDQRSMLEAEAVAHFPVEHQINYVKSTVLSVKQPLTVAKKIELTALPILMYHHIRVYKNAKDIVGQRLSVDPAHFAEQLDEIKKLGYQTVTFKDLADGNIPAKPIILTFDDGYRDVYEYAYPELLKRNMTAVFFIITDVIGDPAYMTSAQIQDLSKHDFEIGSHTLTHPGLALLKPDKQKTEIFDSKTKLEKLLGQPVISFCYPYGNYNDETVKLVKEAGYLYATTTKTGEAETQSPFLLKRLRMPDAANTLNLLKKY